MQPQTRSVKGFPACSICLSAPAEPELHAPRLMCEECHTLTIRAMNALSVARQDGCLRQGYHPSSWRDLEGHDRLDHAATHIYMHKRGDKTEDHLAHAICDLVMSYDRES